MRKFVILAILVAALGAAMLVLRERDDATARGERKSARLLDFDERLVNGIVITTQGVEWRFLRDETGWRIVDPVVDVAFDFAIDDLMSATELVPVLRTIEDPEALSAYGLDPPVSTIRFDDVDQVLHIGDAPPTRDLLFARVEGRPGVLVLALTDQTRSLMTLPDSDNLRNPDFLGITPTAIVSMSASSPVGEVRLEREDDGWWIVEPRRLPASDRSVDQIVRALEAVEIREYHDGVDHADPEFGLGAGAVELEVGSPDATRRFVLGAVTEDGGRYATRDDRGSVMAVSAPAIDDLALNPRGLATRRLSRINRYRIESFSYRRGDDSLAVRREGDGWTTDAGEQIPGSKVYEFLSLLFETRVTGWREERADAAPPLAVLRYRLDGGQEGSIEFLPGDEARVSEASGIVYGLAGSAPGVLTHR